MIISCTIFNSFIWEIEYYSNIWHDVVSDKATFVYVNIFVRSFSKIDDVKMVRNWTECQYSGHFSLS